MTALAGLRVRYRIGDRTVLDDVDVQLRGGQSVALMGPSGSGKTTLLWALGGLLRPDSGQILLDDQVLTERGRRDVAFVLQGYGLVSLLTATENIEIVLRAADVEPAAAHERALAALELLDLTDSKDHLVEELSGGQQQRVAVAMALARRSPVVLADEPTAAQDPEHRELVLSSLLRRAADGAIVALATHDAQVAERCDRIIYLENGVITSMGEQAVPH